jgi:CO/xanthine dehydrogenase Mo-binding subunit
MSNRRLVTATKVYLRAFCIREIGIGEASVEVGLKEEGRVSLVTTVPDTGTGSHTIFRQIAAEDARAGYR